MTSEQVLEEFLSRNLDLIEPGLSLISRQYSTKYGKIDILCADKEGNHVAIEVKNRADTNSPGQLAKYVFAIKQKYAWSVVRGILVSKTISKEVWELCSYFGLFIRELKDLEIGRDETEILPLVIGSNKIKSVKSSKLDI